MLGGVPSREARPVNSDQFLDVGYPGLSALVSLRRRGAAHAVRVIEDYLRVFRRWRDGSLRRTAAPSQRQKEERIGPANSMVKQCAMLHEA